MSGVVHTNYDLLTDDKINVNWSGSRVQLRRPTSLNQIRNVKFRSFIGDMLPFTNLELPTLKCEVVMTSNGLSSKTIEGDDSVYSPEVISYSNTAMNQLLGFSKEWTYDKSSDSQILSNIAECVEEANRRLNVMFPFSGMEERYNINSEEILAYVKKEAGMTLSYGSAFNYYNSTTQKFCVNKQGVETEIIARNPSYNYKLFASNAALTTHIVIYEDSGSLYFEGLYGVNSIAKTAIGSNVDIPSCVFTTFGGNDIVVVGDKLVLSGGEVRSLTINSETVNFADVRITCVGFEADGHVWMLGFKEGDPATQSVLYYNDWEGIIPAEPDLYEVAVSSSTQYEMDNLLRLSHGGETFGNVQMSGGDANYIYWQGSLIALIRDFNSDHPEITTPFVSFAYPSTSGKYYQQSVDGGGNQGFVEVSSFPATLGDLFTTHGFMSTSDELVFNYSAPLKSFTNNYGMVQLDDWGSNSQLINWSSINSNGGRKNSIRCDTSPYRILKSSDLINTTTGGFATDEGPDFMKVNQMWLDESGDQPTISGQITTTEICYTSDKVINLALRIYTDPYWFEVYTPIQYFESVNFSLSHPVLSMVCSTINSHILHTVELLIIMKYEYNDLAFKCQQFPNFDNVVFHINEVATVEFKTAVMDNSVMWLDCYLTSMEDGDLDLETLKNLYGRLTVSIDWES